MNYMSNIDTICLLVDIENYEENCKEILNYLEIEKEKIKSISKDKPTYKHLLSFGNLNFQLLPNGTKGYSYILQNSGFQINIAQFRSRLENFTPLQVRISSEYLWSFGLSDTWSIIYNWISEIFGNIIGEKVFRLDLCSHISDIDLTSNYQITYKGDFKKKQAFFNGNRINAIAFGSRKCKKIYCRIYNKSLEIQELRHKTWFYPIWKENSMNIDNVWNIEFELKSEFLRQYNIVTVNDVLTHLQDLWKYCTSQWLIRVNRTNKRIERCPIDKQWLEIQNNFNSFHSVGLIERKKQIEIDANVLIPNIVGNITSYSARKGNFNIDEAFFNLYKDTKFYLDKKETCFEKEVSNKLILLDDCEVTKNE